jgi:hypothetical protein
MSQSVATRFFFSNFRRIIVEHVIVNQHYRTYFMHLFVTIFVIIVRVSDRFSRNTTRMFHMFIVSFRKKVFYNNIYKSAIFKRFYDELNSCKKKNINFVVMLFIFLFRQSRCQIVTVHCYCLIRRVHSTILLRKKKLFTVRCYRLIRRVHSTILLFKKNCLRFVVTV